MDIHFQVSKPLELIPKSAGYVGLLIFLSYVFNTFFRSPRKQQHLKQLPGPKPKPFIGNLLDLPPKGVIISPTWGRHRELYGPISALDIMGTKLVILNDYDVARELLDKRSVKTAGRPTMVFAGELCGYEEGIIFMQPSDDFRQMRKFAHSQLGSNMSLAKWNKEIDVEVRRYLLRTLQDPTNCFEHIRNEAGSIILKIIYGYQTDPSGSDRLVHLIDKSMAEFSVASIQGNWLVDTIPALKYLPDWAPGAGFKKVARKYNSTREESTMVPFDFVKKQMAQGLAAPSLVSESLTKGEGGEPLTRRQEENLRSVSMALYAGGADTTVIVMETTYLILALYPEVQRKAQAEIDAVLSQSRLPDASDRPSMPYVEAFIKEVLRWEPLAEAVMPHKMMEDDEYEGYAIPKDSLLLVHWWQLLHDPKHYKEPFQFKPERFLGDSPELDPHNIIWGFGRRICPGRFLATSNLWLQISRTLACFNISAIPGHKPRVDFTVGFLRRPKPFKVDVKIRNERWAELVREVAVTDPLPAEGDAKYL